MKRVLPVLAAALLLGGCATYHSSDYGYRRAVYSDGSYYYPEADGYGDYYYDRPRTIVREYGHGWGAPYGAWGAWGPSYGLSWSNYRGWGGGLGYGYYGGWPRYWGPGYGWYDHGYRYRHRPYDRDRHDRDDRDRDRPSRPRPGTVVGQPSRDADVERWRRDLVPRRVEAQDLRRTPARPRIERAVPARSVPAATSRPRTPVMPMRSDAPRVTAPAPRRVSAPAVQARPASPTPSRMSSRSRVGARTQEP
ncbi:hypothetical protein [Coralloluteibacterium stylophorae]|uniref:Vitellogenin II n=1 Tax=Coralloluteibacterium stylophorae TaxID=1776034 RepID=A0A8J7VU02_9GAMM|nr:hypothetical protein [Coralloluteibacterium stylophorae]MBS7457133.1 hypothetical protein [Coralloluteibacterium stylophorae]